MIPWKGKNNCIYELNNDVTVIVGWGKSPLGPIYIYIYGLMITYNESWIWWIIVFRFDGSTTHIIISFLEKNNFELSMKIQETGMYDFS
jgi:hypothetical protein